MDTVSSVDKKERKTKCRCFKSGSPCDSSCNCKNCANPFGSCVNQEGQTKPGKKQPQATSYGKLRTSTFLGDEMPDGSWTEIETVTIYCILNTLDVMEVESTVQNVSQMYRLLFENCP